jgi:hypothetical protein
MIKTPRKKQIGTSENINADKNHENFVTAYHLHNLERNNIIVLFSSYLCLLFVRFK